jgi:hypothetical protein
LRIWDCGFKGLDSHFKRILKEWILILCLNFLTGLTGFLGFFYHFPEESDKIQSAFSGNGISILRYKMEIFSGI